MRVAAQVGALASERDAPQPIELDIELGVESARAAASDDLADAVDYAQVHAACERVVAGRSFALLEALAAACLDAVFAHPRIRSAKIRVRKPGILNGATPEVELSRANPGKAGVPSVEKHPADVRKY